MRPLLVWWCVLAAASVSWAQTAWSPVSREVERPFAERLQRFGSGVHTAIRPYSTRDLATAGPLDSLAPKAVLPVLDRWSGRSSGKRLRWGPLVETGAGYDAGDHGGATYRGSLGFWTDLAAGPKFSFHADAQGWLQRLPNYLDTFTVATQVTAGEGHAYGERSAIRHYDWNAYASWDVHKYINFTLGRGKHFFGEGHRSLFLSAEAYSYPYLRISTELWRIKYVNLFSMMNDPRGSKGIPSDRERKFTSMHYLSWNATDRINLAIFEAVVWSAGDSLYPRGFDINYLNPVLFYRPTEFRIGSPDNALLGFALNIKAGRHVLFYGQVMLDEFLVDQVRDRQGWYANKQAVQLGVNAHRAFGVEGLQLRGEWNYIRPFMYTHSDTRQNYAHMGQPLAHPYGSGMQEVLAHGDLTRDRWLWSARFSMAWMGTDSVYSYGNNIFRPERDRPIILGEGFDDYGYRIGKFREQTVMHAELRAGWTVDATSGTRLELAYLYRLGEPPTGAANTTHWLRVGLVCYFRERHLEQQVRYVLR